jgi:hypothetical protein
VADDTSGLEFFNGLSGRLKIELTQEPQPISPHLSNVAAGPEAKIVSLTFRMDVWDGRGFRELGEDDWSRVALCAPAIRMRNCRVPDVVVEHSSPDGNAFTVRDLAAAVEETDRRARGDTEWFGGIDVHHVYFEGIRDVDGVWEIHWGS